MPNERNVLDSVKDFVQIKEQTATLNLLIGNTIESLNNNPNRDAILSEVGIVWPRTYKKCWGQGFIGRSVRTGKAVLCQCIYKAIEKRVPIDITPITNKEDANVIEGNEPTIP